MNLLCKKQLFPLYLIVFFVFALSCSNDDEPKNPIIEEEEEKIEEPVSLSSVDLADFKNLINQYSVFGLDLSQILLNNEADKGKPSRIVEVQALKMKAKTGHPNRSNSSIDISGVLLLPKSADESYIKTKRLHLLIVAPSTYYRNENAPSVLFAKELNEEAGSNANSYLPWMGQAFQGKAVFIPDYPGFGDSYGQCFHPYLDKSAIVNSTLDLLNQVNIYLTRKEYDYKKEVMVTGYSQGGWAAANIARELEADESLGYSVKVLIAGGTPCNLKAICDVARTSTSDLRYSYFLPYAIWGYKKNAYPDLNVSNLMLEPWAISSYEVFGENYQGTANNAFPRNPIDLYTEQFRTAMDTNPIFESVNSILSDNSVKPWKNKCSFTMTHAIDDNAVYYQQAKTYSEEHKSFGGNITFTPTFPVSVISPSYDPHVSGYLFYYPIAEKQIKSVK